MLNKSLVFPSRHRAAWAGAAAVLLLLVAPAQAQWFNLGFGLRPEQVEREIFASGYQLTRPVVRNGGVYLADVVGPRGQRQRLVVDATSGRLLQRFHDRRDFYGADSRFSDSGEPIPRPPAMVESRLVGEPLVIPGPGATRRLPDELQARGDDSPFSIFNLNPPVPVVPDAPIEKPKHKPSAFKHRKLDAAPVQPASAPAPSAPAAAAPAATPDSPATIVVAPTPAPAPVAKAPSGTVDAPTVVTAAPQAPRVADTKPPAPAAAAKPRKPVLNDLPVNTLE